MKSQSVIRSLKTLFLTTVGIQIAVFISFAYKLIVIMPEAGAIPVVLDRYALLITLISIPGALKLFSVMMKNNKHPEDISFTSTLYIKAFVVRFGILFIVSSFNIVLFAISYKQNFMLCTLLTFTAYLFAYPTANFMKVKGTKEEEIK